MDSKAFDWGALFPLLLTGVVLFSGCAQKAEEKASVTTLKAEEEVAITTPSEKALNAGSGTFWCVVGSGYTLGGVSFKRTGIETHTLNGVSMDLCCGSGESARTGEKTRKCSSEKGDRDYSITWLANKETGGEYVLWKEVYQQDGKMCIRLFDAHGNEEKVTCTAEP